MKATSNEELERRFDEGEDVTAFMDMSSARRHNLQHISVHLDMPVGMARGIDRAAARIGTSGEALMNVWFGERLDEEKHAVMAKHGEGLEHR